MEKNEYCNVWHDRYAHQILRSYQNTKGQMRHVMRIFINVISFNFELFNFFLETVITVANFHIFLTYDFT